MVTSFSLLQQDVFEKSQVLLLDELSRCSLLGLNLFNFHPGSSLGSITTEQCIEKIAGAINHAHQQTPAVVTGTVTRHHRCCYNLFLFSVKHLFLNVFFENPVWIKSDIQVFYFLMSF